MANSMDLERMGKVVDRQTSIKTVNYKQKLEGAKLHIEIDATGDSKLQYACYLIRDGERIFQSSYYDSPVFTFSLETPGEYQATIFVKSASGDILYRQTNPVIYFYCNGAYYGSTVLKDILEASPQVHNVVQERIELEQEWKNKLGVNIFLIDFLEFARMLEHQFIEITECDGGDEQNHILLFQAKNLLEIKEKFRKSLLQIKQSCPKVLFLKWTFQIPGNLSSKETYERQKLNWILEELYDSVEYNCNEFVAIELGKVSYNYGCVEEDLKEFYAVNINKVREIVDNAIQIIGFGEVGFFSVELTKEGCKLTASIVQKNMTKGNLYYFYLLRNGIVFDKIGWKKESQYSWDITEDGIYCVKGYIKHREQKIDRYSKTVEFFSPAIRENFVNFLGHQQSNEGLYGQELKLFEPAYPFYDFFVISTPSSSETGDLLKMEGLLEKYPSFRCIEQRRIGKYYSRVYSNGEFRILTDGSALLFSGTTIINNHFINGIEDLPCDVSIKDIRGNNGCFSYLHSCDEGLLLGTDFFNFNHLYYYFSESICIVSNRYHLLLLALAQLGFSMKLDILKACVTLSTVSVQSISQNFSRKMDISQTYQLENDKELIFSLNGWGKNTNLFGEALKEKTTYHESAYKNLLSKAKYEIINNVKCILEDERFDQVVIDLTGGLDSRMVYSAATCLPSSREKIVINSYHVPGSRDLDVATRINGMYGYPYDTLPRKQRFEPIVLMDQMMRSFYLGTYFSHNLVSMYSVDQDYMRLNGACGEILARPYYCRKYFGTMLENEVELNGFAEYIGTDYSPNLCIGDENAFEYFTPYLADELSKIPVDNLFEAFDRQYLMFRHGYHFDCGIKYTMRTPEWMPLQSKTMFKLHHMVSQRFKSIKLQLDILYLLNPMVAAVDFDSDKDNEAVEELRSSLMIEDERFRNIRIDGRTDMERWKQADEQRKMSRVIVKRVPEPKASSKKEKELSEIMYDSLIYNFRCLMNEVPQLSDRIGVALYYFIINNNNDKKRMRFLYNKVTSLLDQIRIFKVNNGEKVTES